MAVINKDIKYMDFPLSIKRQFAGPVDYDEQQFSLAEAQEYAQGQFAYVGQFLKVINEESGDVDVYVIKNEAGDLKMMASGGDTNALESRIGSLESWKTTASSQISGLETSVDSLDGELDTLSAKVTNLDSTTIKNTGNQTITGSLNIVKSGDGTGNVVIDGNLTVKGTTITESQESLLVKDNMIIANSAGATLTQLSGLAIRKDSTDTYGITYDPNTDSVNLGLGKLDSSNEFTFNEGEGAPIVVRDISDDFTNGHLIMWKGEGTKIVDADIAASDIALKSEIPTKFTLTGNSNILQVTGGENSLSVMAQVSETSITGRLTLNAAGKLDFGGAISANGTTLTGNLGTVTQVVAGTGLTGGTITTSGTVAHAVPAGAEAKEESANSGATVIQDVLTDKFGHVVGTATKTLTAADVGAATPAEVNAKYTKPSTGIPKTDLDETVQASLGKADTALQSIPSNVAKTDALNTFTKDQSITGSLTLSGSLIMNTLALTAPDQAGQIAVKANIPTKLPTPQVLTFGSKSFDGSVAQTITAADIGAATPDQIPDVSDYVPITRRINNKTLDGDITLTAADVGAATSADILALVKYESISAMVGDEHSGYTFTSTAAGYAPLVVYNSDGEELVVSKQKTATGYVISSDINFTGYVVSIKVA